MDFKSLLFININYLLIVLLPLGAGTLGGCASYLHQGTTDSPPSALGQDGPGLAEKGGLPVQVSPDSSFAGLDPDLVLPPEPKKELPRGPEGFATLESLNELLDDTLDLLADDDLALAQDHLFTLEEQFSSPLPAGVDSLYSSRLLSVQRQVWFLDGILAEKAAFAGSSSQEDSLLAAGYARLGNFAFPDSLVPATGITLPAFTADLMKINNLQVSRWVNYFSGRGHRNFQHWLDRKAQCDSLVTTILRQEGVPPQLIYLAVIESGLGTRAVSGVGAVGPWQFMPATGKGYGLRQSWWLDERRDLEMSTRAAAKHLKYLHQKFGDWALVLAAYNSGENRVARRIRLHGHDNFWNMNLPSQTTAYVPKFIAAARIGQNPEKYGFNITPQPPLQYDVVQVRDATHLQLMAKCAGSTPEELIRLNPALLRGASPPGMKGYPIRVPLGTRDRAVRSLSKIPLDKRLTWRRHKVVRGENLGQIARRYGSTVHDIAKLNKLKSANLIRPGDQLLIPMPAQLTQLANKRAREHGHYVPPAGYKRVSYKVKSGDTLGGIGHKLGVSVKHLKKVNGLKRSNLIYPGQKLYAYRPNS